MLLILANDNTKEENFMSKKAIDAGSNNTYKKMWNHNVKDTYIYITNTTSLYLLFIF